LNDELIGSKNLEIDPKKNGGLSAKLRLQHISSKANALRTGIIDQMVDNSCSNGLFSPSFYPPGPPARESGW